MLRLTLLLCLVFRGDIGALPGVVLPTEAVDVTVTKQHGRDLFKITIHVEDNPISLRVERDCNHGDRHFLFEIQNGQLSRHSTRGRVCTDVYTDRRPHTKLTIKHIDNVSVHVQGQFCHNNSLYHVQPIGVQHDKLVTITTPVRHVLVTKKESVCSRELDTLRSLDQSKVRPRKRRSTSQTYTVELLIVVDFAAYHWWYSLSDGSTGVNRDTETMDRIWQYYGFIFQGMNSRFQSIKKKMFEIRLSFSGLVVAKTEEESLWTHNVTMDTDYDSIRPMVNSSEALEKFQTWADETKNLPSFDHAMLFTGTNLTYAGSPGNTGLAFAASMCRNISNTSMVEDAFDFRTTLYATQQLARSLGASDDMDNNDCLEFFNFIMTPRTKIPISSFPANRWRFSTCSVDYFRDYLNELQQDKMNCLGTPSSPPPDILANILQTMPGDVITADQQCAQKFGLGSTICRVSIGENYAKLCAGLYCTVHGQTGCDVILPGDGTVCGNKKHCQNGVCVRHKSGQERLDICPFGDDPSARCTLPTTDIYMCYNNTFRYSCCVVCQRAIIGETGCEYGDREPTCTLNDCTTDDKMVHDVTCCATCADGPTPYAPPGPESMTSYPATSTQQVGTRNDDKTDVTQTTISTPTMVISSSNDVAPDDVTPVDVPFTETTAYYDNMYDATLPNSDYFYTTLARTAYSTATFLSVPIVSSDTATLNMHEQPNSNPTSAVSIDTKTMATNGETMTSSPTEDLDLDPDGNNDSPATVSLVTTSISPQTKSAKPKGKSDVTSPVTMTFLPDVASSKNTITDYFTTSIDSKGTLSDKSDPTIMAKYETLSPTYFTTLFPKTGEYGVDTMGSGVEASLTSIFPQTSSKPSLPTPEERESPESLTTTMPTTDNTMTTITQEDVDEANGITTSTPVSSTTPSDGTGVRTVVTDRTLTSTDVLTAETSTGRQPTDVWNGQMTSQDMVTSDRDRPGTKQDMAQISTVTADHSTTELTTVDGRGYTTEEALYLRQLYNLLLYEHRNVKSHFNVDIMRMRNELDRLIGGFPDLEIGHGTNRGGNFWNTSADVRLANRLTGTWRRGRYRLHVHLDMALRRLRYRALVKVKRFLGNECQPQVAIQTSDNTCAPFPGGRHLFTLSGRRLLGRVFHTTRKQQRVVHRGLDFDLRYLKVKVDRLIRHYLDIDTSSSAKGSNSYSSPDDEDICRLLARTFHQGLSRLDSGLDSRVRELRFKILSLVHHYVRTLIN